MLILICLKLDEYGELTLTLLTFILPTESMRSLSVAPPAAKSKLDSLLKATSCCADPVMMWLVAPDTPRYALEEPLSLK